MTQTETAGVDTSSSTPRSTERSRCSPSSSATSAAEHNLLGAPIAETVFEPRVGGNIVDRAVDGTECRWALMVEPPVRVVFSWDIGPQWASTDPDMTSEVEVRFHAETPQRTRVELDTGTSNAMGPTEEPSPAA